MKRLLLRLDRWLFAGPWQRASFLLALLVLSLLAYDSHLGPLADEVDAERDRELSMRQEYADKVKVAVALPGLRHQLASMQPGAAQAPGFSVNGFTTLAHGLGLRIERLQAHEAEAQLEAVAVHSTRITLSGSFEQFAALAEAVAARPERFALRRQNWTVARGAPGLMLDVVLDLYRPLEAEELAALRKAKAKAMPKAGAR